MQLIRISLPPTLWWGWLPQLELKSSRLKMQPTDAHISAPIPTCQPVYICNERNLQPSVIQLDRRAMIYRPINFHKTLARLLFLKEHPKKNIKRILFFQQLPILSRTRQKKCLQRFARIPGNRKKNPPSIAVMTIETAIYLTYCWSLVFQLIVRAINAVAPLLLFTADN